MFIRGECSLKKIKCFGYQKDTTQSRYSTGTQDKEVIVKDNQFEKSQIAKEILSKDSNFHLCYFLKIIKLPKQTYYFYLKRIDLEEITNNELVIEVKELFSKHRSCYDARRITIALNNADIEVNHKKI